MEAEDLRENFETPIDIFTPKVLVSEVKLREFEALIMSLVASQQSVHAVRGMRTPNLSFSRFNHPCEFRTRVWERRRFLFLFSISEPSFAYE
jgi:hypothetical protein